MQDVISQLLELPGLTPNIKDWLNQYQEHQILQDNYDRNKAYAKIEDNYQTELDPNQENLFTKWVTENNVPFNSKQKLQDYDMRGFWLALQNKDPIAMTAVNPNDNVIHYPDYWKTPYHKSFSNESKWATENAPKWNDKDQLVSPNGEIVFDEKKGKTK